MKWLGSTKAAQVGTWTARPNPLPSAIRVTLGCLSFMAKHQFFFYINSKGQISFGGDVIDWTPTGFLAAEYNQQVDIGKTIYLSGTVGEIKWKKTQDAVYNFIGRVLRTNQSDLYYQPDYHHVA